MTKDELIQYPEYQKVEREFQEKKKKQREREFKPQGLITYYLPGETVKLL